MVIRIKIIGELSPSKPDSFTLTKKTEKYENPFFKSPALEKNLSFSKFFLLNLYSLKYNIERVIVDGYINKDLDYLTKELSLYEDNFVHYLYQNLDSSKFFSTSFTPLKKSPNDKHCAFSKLLLDFLKSSEGKKFLLQVKTLVLSHPNVQKLKNEKIPSGRKSISRLEKNIFLTKDEPEVFIKKYFLEFKNPLTLNLKDFVFNFFSFDSDIKVCIKKENDIIYSSIFKNRSSTNKNVLFETSYGFQGFKISKKKRDPAVFFEVLDFKINFPVLDNFL